MTDLRPGSSPAPVRPHGGGVGTPNPLNIPNFISLARALLVPIVFWLLVTGRVQAAFLVFVIAGLSDAIDGFLAKRYGWRTELGAYLDPLADKLLVVCIFVAMAALGELPLWLVVAVVFRDVLIVSAVILSWLLARPVRMKPSNVSKANTAAQLVLASTVLADTGFALGLAPLRVALVWITAALTIVSLAAYLHAWLRHMTGSESGSPSV